MESERILGIYGGESAAAGSQLSTFGDGPPYGKERLSPGAAQVILASADTGAIYSAGAVQFANSRVGFSYNLPGVLGGEVMVLILKDGFPRAILYDVTDPDMPEVLALGMVLPGSEPDKMVLSFSCKLAADRGATGKFSRV